MRRSSFGDGWRVRPRVNPFTEMFSPGAVADWTEVTLPHDAMIRTERRADAPHSLGYFAEGEWQYEKRFHAPEEWREQFVALEFEAVYRSAVVWLNGTQIAQRAYGYSQFTVDLRDHLVPGSENVVRVECTARADSRWYSGAGLHRPVHLVVGGPVRVVLDGVVVTTPTVGHGGALVRVATELVNDGRATADLTMTTELVDASGTVVAHDVAPVTLVPRRATTVRQRIHLTDPQRWSVDAPNLYECRTTVRAGDEIVDTSTTMFGVRTIAVDPVHGLRVNGEPVKFRGACIHHDNGVLGSCAIARADERRVELLKAAGFNALRSAHNPMSRSMLDACDRLGMLVMDEAFDMWTQAKSNDDYSRAFADEWAADIDAMVVKDRNHPSVILYSIGNEIPETGKPSGAALGRALTERIRALDDTRLVTNGINPLLACSDTILAPFLGAGTEQAAAQQSAVDGPADGEERDVNQMMSLFEEYLPLLLQQEGVGTQLAESYSFLDVAGYNYAESRYAMDGELFPQRVIVGSENRPPFVAEGWKLVQEMPHVIGDFTWVGWDYLGEAGIGRISYDPPPRDAGPTDIMGPFPWISARSGDLDITGFRRPVSYWREIVYGLATGPVLAVQPPERHGQSPVYKSSWALSDAISSWDWPEHVGAPITVELYADADEVELLVNDESVGRAPAGAEHQYRALVVTEYRTGTLVAVAYRDGAEMGRTALTTPTGAVTLQVGVDRAEIRADETDLAYVTIELVDGDGTRWTSADRAVTVTVDGPAVLQGLGSANPCTEETFGSDTHDTFQGRALAVVRPTGAGTVTVTVASAGCETRVVTIEAR